MAALLVVVDALDAVAPAEALPDDLGGLDLDPLLPHQVLPVLQHRHRVPIRVLRVEVIRRLLVELNLRLAHHLLRSPPPPPPLLRLGGGWDWCAPLGRMGDEADGSMSPLCEPGLWAVTD